MAGEEHSAICREIDEDTIELHAMGRLEGNSIRQHLDTCDICRGRVAEHRSWIEDLKRGLLEFRQAEQSAAKSGDAGDASPQDEP